MKNIFIFFLFLLVFVACKKDKEVETIKYNPTSVTLAVPDWVESSIVGSMPIPADNPLTIEGIALGRELFYEKMLSGDNTKSCASCHLQEDNFSDPEQFSEGISGDLGTRQAMAIINLGWDSKFFWDGRAISLEDQAFGPVVNPIELNDTWQNVESKLNMSSKYQKMFAEAFGTSKIDSNLVVKAISQFERSMISFNSKYDKFFYENDASVYNTSEMNGFDLFFGDAECIHCHSGPLLNDPVFRNNGLDVNLTDLGLGEITNIASDNGKFKVTSLRNIAESGPYMHDGRFTTLEEVVEHYNSGVEGNSPNLDSEMEHFVGGVNLTAAQKNDLVAFLKTFSDVSFLTNSEFSDPN